MMLNFEVRSLIDVVRMCSIKPSKEFINGQDELIEAIYLGIPLKPILIDKNSSKWNLLVGYERMQIVSNFYYNIFMVKYVQIIKNLEHQCLATIKNKNFQNSSITCYFLPKLSKQNRSIFINMFEKYG